MGRLVRKPVVPDLDLQIAGLEGVLQSDIAGMQLAAAVPGDNYVERMVKYIPGEVIGFSMLINAILDQAMKAGGSNAAMAGLPIAAIATGALLIGCILTPLFCWYVREDGDAWIVNAMVSTIAFPFWAYLMGAVAFANVHDGNLAVILVLTFTVVSGLISPVANRPKLQARQEAAPPKDGPRLVEAFA
jgi:heme/copper-type cytochrome/quinol oxidase subunit 3